jgi:Flp pilus assembly protein TadG
MRDRGQAAVLLVIIGATLFVLMMTALSNLGSRVLDRVQAQTAADAAALASLDGGRQVADQIAHRHGAIVISWWRGPGPDEVSVAVRVGDSTATARATDGLERD